MINLLFLYYPILLGFLLFFWNDNRLLPLVIFPPYGCQNPLPKRMSFWDAKRPSIRKFLAFARNDNHLGSLTFGLSASVNFIFSFRASAVPEQECFVRHLAWCRFDKTYFCAGAAVKNFSLHVHARRPAKQFRWRILLYTRMAVKFFPSPPFLCGKEERFICLLRFYMISSFPYRR